MQCTEPTGFRGVAWGQDFHTVQGMIPFFLINPEQMWGFYVRPADEMKMGDAIVSSIQYAFWKHKFAGAIVTCIGRDRFEAVRQAAIDKYGADNVPELSARTWYAGDLCITLTYKDYNEDTEEREIGELFVFCERIFKDKS